ncbi:MAG: T9SS type A sorting domain-containing protein [Bacteroidales bacterium]|nr:T9SS type A sorting domain-containing protein [Bacteroidales bacterium]
MATRLQNLKRLAIFVAMLVISLSVNAQTWYIYGEYTWSAPHPVGTFHEHHYQSEAVTIGGVEYITIYVDSEVNGNYLDGAYRNDDNQVFYCKWNGSSYDDEVLLYDYDLEVGDFFHDDDDHPMQVTEVTTITDLNGVSRKKITFSFIGLTDVSEFWIEGVGSNRGFMHVGQWEADHDSEGEMYHLLCYHEDNNVIFVNPEYNDCDMPYAVEDNSKDTNVSIYPNPAKDVIKILNDNSLNITSIEILDLTGRTVLSTDKSSGINISELPEGQYFVKIYGTTTIVRKLFITK